MGGGGVRQERQCRRGSAAGHWATSRGVASAALPTAEPPRAVTETESTAEPGCWAARGHSSQYMSWNFLSPVRNRILLYLAKLLYDLAMEVLHASAN